MIWLLFVFILHIFFSIKVGQTVIGVLLNFFLKTGELIYLKLAKLFVITMILLFHLN